MYHFTSGRLDFESLPFHNSQAIRDILAFQDQGNEHCRRSSIAKLQRSIMEAQQLLSNLRTQTEGISFPSSLNTSFPVPLDDDGSSSDESDEA